MLLMGAFAMFLWFGQTLVERQSTYRQTWIQGQEEFVINYFTPDKIDLFGEY